MLGRVYTDCLLSYETLLDRPRDFLAATSLTPEAFRQLLPAFEAAYEQRYTREMTQAGQPRRRRPGGGATGALSRFADKLLCILVSQKTNPLQTMHALQCAMRQPQANDWMHHVLPVLPQALADLGMRPERAARRVAGHPLTGEGTPDVALDGTERRRQRPVDPPKQQEHYSGKKTTPTDQPLFLVHAQTGTVVSLGPTLPGKTHDKKAADTAQIAYPVHATLDKDTGLQGYEPEGAWTRQPKKTARPGLEHWGSLPPSPFLQGPCHRRKRHCRRQTVPDGQRGPAPHHRGDL